MTKGIYFRCALFCLILKSMPLSASEILECVNERHIPPVATLSDLADPSLKGEYSFDVIQYGEKPHLFAFSAPEIISQNVSLPAFLSDYSRNQGYKDDAYHDFDSQNLPLDAKVWLPKNNGPQPLVLLVHGNSAPGFDYLGELLASRGYFVAQIDQTYLNRMWGENGARGWIILEHLKQLKGWNSENNHLFFNRMDLDNIALIGMSRGGEAVALAASFNAMDTIPNSVTPTEFGFNIKSVIALAPMDGQYQHSDGRNTLKNVNYLVLQGGHDADVYQFLGSQQWHRTVFEDGKQYRKQAIYIYRGNHVNFNQDMSDDFRWGGTKKFYEKLLSPSQQEQLTKVFVSAFLDATIKGDYNYSDFLNNPIFEAFDLPADIYISRYQTSDFWVIEDFEIEPYTSRKIAVSSDNTPIDLTSKIDFERLRNGTETSNHVLALSLPKQQETVLEFTLSSTALWPENRTQTPYFQFSLAQMDAGLEGDCEPYNLLSDASVSILDGSDVVFEGSFGNQDSLAPLLVSDYSELEDDDAMYPPTEPVLQTFSIPILSVNHLEMSKDLKLVLRFSPNKDISIMLDDFGISRGR